MTSFEQHIRGALDLIMNAVNLGADTSHGQEAIIRAIACADYASTCAYTAEERLVARSVRKVARKLVSPTES
jgi:hypothetical protein